MKKRYLAPILAMSLVLLSTMVLTASADMSVNFDGSTGMGQNEIGASLSLPAPLPKHLAQYADSDSWLIYDFDGSQVLEIVSDEFGKIYTMLEGATFTFYQNPSWNGVVHSVSLYDEEGYFYRTSAGVDPANWPYMPPITITFTHNAAIPDGTTVDLAQQGKIYDVDFEVEWNGEYGVSGRDLHQRFYVIPTTAYASPQTITIDGKPVEFQMYALKDADGNDTNYVKVRDVALALDGTAAQFNVGWDGNINLEKGQPYTARNGQENNTPYSGNQPFKASTSTTNVNGARASLTAFVITDANGNGSTYYKLRDLGAALGFAVDWDTQRGVYIETAPIS